MAISYTDLSWIQNGEPALGGDPVTPDGGVVNRPLKELLQNDTDLQSQIDVLSGGSGSGDMTKAVYDTNDNGIVDNSEALEGQSLSYVLDRTNHSGVMSADDMVDGVTNKVYTSAEKLKLANVPSDTSGELAAKADIADVLIKGGTTSYDPTTNYSPATKKYVDDHLNGDSISLTTTGFAGNLSSADNTVQKAFDTIDDLLVAATLPGLSDVTISAPANGEVLTYNAGVWGNSSPAGTGDMLKSVYDTGDNGIVDNSEALGGSSLANVLDCDNHTSGTANKVYTVTEQSKVSNVPSDTNAELALKSDSADVLELTNTTAYTPTSDYHPATKKYVDDNLTSDGISTTTTGFTGNLSAADNTVQKALDTLDDLSIGTGDMTKAIYDTGGNGIVDNSEALNGQAASYYLDRTNHTGTQASTTVTVSTTSFAGNLSAADDTVQKALDTIDDLTLGGGTLNELTDVNVPSPSTDEVLTWSGSQWVSQAASGGVNYVEIQASEFSPDDTHTGQDGGQMFNIIDCYDFDPDTDGSIWMNVKIPDTWETTSDVLLDMYYTLDGDDASKNFNVKADIWQVALGDAPVEGTPTETGSETIASSTSNQGKFVKATLTTKLSNANFTSTDGIFVIKLHRQASDGSDTYAGILKIAKIIVRQ